MGDPEEQREDVGAEARRALDELDSSDEMESRLDSLDADADDVDLPDLPGVPDSADVGSRDEAADGDEEDGAVEAGDISDDEGEAASEAGQ